MRDAVKLPSNKKIVIALTNQAILTIYFKINLIALKNRSHTAPWKRCCLNLVKGKNKIKIRSRTILIKIANKYTFLQFYSFII